MDTRDTMDRSDTRYTSDTMDKRDTMDTRYTRDTRDAQCYSLLTCAKGYKDCLSNSKKTIIRFFRRQKM